MGTSQGGQAREVKKRGRTFVATPDEILETQLLCLPREEAIRIAGLTALQTPRKDQVLVVAGASDENVELHAVHDVMQSPACIDCKEINSCLLECLQWLK